MARGGEISFSELELKGVHLLTGNRTDGLMTKLFFKFDAIELLIFIQGSLGLLGRKVVTLHKGVIAQYGALLMVKTA